jgi:glutamate dehydrogenase
MRAHRLRREITATSVVNDLVNKGGPSFAFRLGEETGAAPADIARAYTTACEVFDMRSLWAEIEALDNRVDAQTQTRMLLDWRRLVERATRWFLRSRRPPLDISATVSYFSEGTSELTRRLSEFLLDGDREAMDRATEQLVEANVPPEVARRVAILGAMFSELDIVDIATATDEALEDLEEVAGAYFTLGDRLRLHWLRGHFEALPRENRWQALARAALRDDLYGQQAELTAEILRNTAPELPAHERIDAWVDANRAHVERALQVLTDISASGNFVLATLSVALREIRNLITSSGVPPTEVEVEPVPRGQA